MLSNLQLICFEVSNKCNLAEAHKAFCPSCIKGFRKGSKPATNGDFISFLDSCIEAGFKGKVGFHFYNEPTLAIERCIDIGAAANSRGLETVLWSNGTKEISQSWFDEIFVTEYQESIKDNCTKAIPYQPDDRLKIYDAEATDNYKPCCRPSHIEMPIDYFGNIHLCCSDWRGEYEIGSILHCQHDMLLNRWKRAIIDADHGCDICMKCQGLCKSPACYDKGYLV